MGFSRLCSLIVLTLVASSGKSVEPSTFYSEADWPSCSELRMMWLSLQSPVRQIELTNEIPKLPTNLINRAHHHRGRSPHWKHRKLVRQGETQDLESMTSREDPFTILNPTEGGFREFSSNPRHNPVVLLSTTLPRRTNPDQKTMTDVFGGFNHDFSGQASFSPVGSWEAVSHRDEASSEPRSVEPLGQLEVVDAFVPPFDADWGPLDSDETGTFGRFDDNDRTKAIQKASIRSSKSDSLGWHGVVDEPELFTPVRDATKVNCEEIENVECSNNDHCACNGWIFSRCIAGRCRAVVDAISSDQVREAWHDGPLPSIKLGMVPRRRRRSRRSKYM